MGDVQQWKTAIECGGRVVVLENTTSTQEAALEQDLKVGDVCAAIHQSAGRGRGGNTWDSSGGIAVTVVLENATPQLSIAVAAVLAENLQILIPDHAIGIKWPNDLLVDERKLAGILIEQHNEICLVGIGVNVQKVEQAHAVSLHELGSTHASSHVANVVVSSVFSANELDQVTATTSWLTRDVLVGTTQSFISDNKQVTGTVLNIDPMHSLVLETEAGVVTLHATTTTNITTPARQS